MGFLQTVIEKGLDPRDLDLNEALDTTKRYPFEGGDPPEFKKFISKWSKYMWK